MARSTKEKEEPKLTLPPGHPNAGYVEPDLSLQDGTGTLPDDLQAWHDKRDETRQESVDAVAEAEDKTARDELKRQEEEAETAAKEQEKSVKETTSTSTSSAKSS